MVVISLVRSNERGRIGFLRVPNRLNVAISRARRLVVCVGDAATLRAGEETMYGRLVDAARDGGGYLKATELLGGRTARPRSQPRRPVPVGTTEGAADGAAPRRRRRRRRHPVTTVVAGTEAAVTSTTPATGGDQPARRRRRRRRRPPQAAGLVPGQAEVLSLPLEPSSEAAGPGNGTRRRARHRRRGARPEGLTVGGGEQTQKPETSEGVQ
jgi:hypothetical protein